MVIVDYYNLPFDKSEWLDEEIKLYEASCSNYHQLKIKLSREFPELYTEVTKKLDLIKILDDDIELSVILAMDNKLSHEYKHLKIILLMQNSEILKPEVIGYYYDGLVDETML